MSYTFETTQYTKTKYLQDVLSRLQNEVGTLLECVKEHNSRAVLKNERTIGYWATIRMLMPVVESVTEVVGEKPWNFLEKHLDVTAPHLAWQIFRHSLTHGDLLRHVKYGSETVGWGVILMGQGHIIGKGQISLDVYTLYDKLVEYLKSEIAKNDQSIVNVKVGINYANPEQYIIDDFQKLK